MDCILDDSTELTLNFLVIIMVLFLYRRIASILRRRMMKYRGVNDSAICEAKWHCHVQLFMTPGLQPTRLLCPWHSPGKKTGVGCHSLLQGIFPTQGSNPSLLHCRHILYCLSHQGRYDSVIYF